MAPEEKPYRVYRGGRTKGKVPGPARPERARRRPEDDGARRYRGPSGGRPARPGKRRRRILIGVLVFFVLVVVWMLASYLAFRGGVSDATDGPAPCPLSRVPTGEGWGGGLVVREAQEPPP